MTTFQTILYSIIHGFTEFLPISSAAHEALVPYLMNWPTPEGAIAGAMALGAFLAVFLYFVHDWASIISSFIQVIVFRKKPMTLDERLPIFIAITLLPTGLAWWYLRDLVNTHSTPVTVAASLALFGLPLWLADSMSRKHKGMFDWNWLDALVSGIGQALLVIPGCGWSTGLLSAGRFRSYNREAIAKYGFFAAAPLLAASAVRHLREVNWHDAMPQADLSWFSFIIAIIITTLAGLLAIGGFMKHIQRKGFGQYIIYRLLLAGGVLVVYWIRSRN